MTLNALKLRGWLSKDSTIEAPEGGAESDFVQYGLGLLRGEGMPAGRKPVTVPGFAKPPSLMEGQGSAARNFPGAAPAPHVLFRPEEQNGLSGEDDVLVPARCGHSEMNNAGGGLETATKRGELHG